LSNTKKNIKPYKVLLQNFTSLSILQVTNYLFPLITLPYLVRILGPEKYGLVSFAIAFMGYFITISDYGFNLNATKQISQNRDDKQKIIEIFSSVLTSKILFGIFSLILFSGIIFSFAKFTTESTIYFLSFGMVIGNILFPVWFFQGMEDMKPLTIITFLARLIGTFFIFGVIKDASDYYLLILIYSLVSISIGIMGLFFVSIKFRVIYTIPTYASIKYQIAQGFHVFISMVAINLYTTTNIFLLGIFVNDTAVGYFSAADKIRTAVQNIIPILSQTVFPYVNKLLSESYSKFLLFIKKLLKYQTILSGIISIAVFLFAGDIVQLLLGKEFQQSVLILKILAVLPFLSSYTSIFAVNILIPLSQENDFMKTFLSAGVVSLFSAIIIIPVYKEIGTAIVVVVAEFVAASISFYYVNKKIKLFG
jgi:polysaccharide transporter, PST family